MTQPIIWGLLDDRPGHANQVRGLLGALGGPYEEKPLSYNVLAKLPNLFLDVSLSHLSAKARAGITAPWPDIVIACGRRSEPVARYIKRNSPTTKLVYLMTPSSLKDWDMLVIPTHDDPPQDDARILRTLGPLHNVTPERLAEAARGGRYLSLPQPRIGVLLGGAPKGGRFDEDAALRMLRAAERMAEGGSLLITGSRRTPPLFRSKTMPLLKTPCDWYDWHSGGENPYLSLLASADALVVAGDSLSMCAEACSTGRSVFIESAPSLPPKHRAMHAMLFAQGYAHPLGKAMTPEPSSMILQETQRVASILREQLSC